MSIPRRAPPRLGRRAFAARAAALVAATGVAAVGRGEAPASAVEEILLAQRADPSREPFMAQAFEMRRIAVEAGDQPFGAVVVQDGQVVGEGPSRVVTNGDPTAHAEMEAVRDAARRLGVRSLSGCEIYATSRPCRMCEAACYWANVGRIYYSAEIVDAGAPRLGPC